MKEYPEGPFADFATTVYDKIMYYTGVALGYMFKGFFLAAGALLAWSSFNYLMALYN